MILRADGVEPDWPLDVKEARHNQNQLKRLLVAKSLDLSTVRSTLAIGVGYSASRGMSIATGVPMDLTGTAIDRRTIFVKEVKRDFPYVPGLFAYREGPAIIGLLEALPGLPDLLLFCSQGVAHPRSFGLAAHIGVLVGRPSLGITRKPLFGSAEPPVEEDRGLTQLIDRAGNTLGFCYRLLAHCDPIYASPGNLTDLDTLREFLQGITSIRACFPEALSFAQSTANRLAFAT